MTLKTMKTKRKHNYLKFDIDYLIASKLTIYYLTGRLKPEYNRIKITKREKN